MNQMPFSLEEIESQMQLIKEVRSQISKVEMSLTAAQYKLDQMQRENAYYLKAMVGGIAW
jgi:hypothetical protein